MGSQPHQLTSQELLSRPAAAAPLRPAPAPPSSSRAPAPPPWQRPPAPHGTTGQARLSPPAGREVWPELLQSGREASPLQQKSFLKSHFLLHTPINYLYNLVTISIQQFRVSAFLFKSVLNCFETFKHSRLTLLEIIHSFTNLPQKWSSVWHWPFLVNGSVKWPLFETMGR